MNESEINKLSEGPYEWGIIQSGDKQMKWVEACIARGSGDIHLIWLPKHPNTQVGTDPTNPENVAVFCMFGNGPNSRDNCRAMLCMLAQRGIARQAKEERKLPIPTTPDTVAWAEYAIMLENALGIADPIPVDLHEKFKSVQ